MEGDFIRQRHSLKMSQDFNPRPPWGGRPGIPAATAGVLLFQSTPSVGRATTRRRAAITDSVHFNPRPPWGGRPSPAAVRYSSVSISIHALRGEGDKIGREIGKYIGISIHALRGEGDVPIRRDCFIPLAFQSTPSVGRATIYTSGTQAGRLFQSTPSVGRATCI